MQKKTNNACLAEAKSYMNSVVANFAQNTTAPSYQASACEARTVPLIAQYLSGASTTFVPHTRGTASLKKNTTCNAGNANCQLVP